MNKIKKLYYIFTPITLGFTTSLITKSGMKDYALLNKPIFAPPKIVFPIVWTFLYILLGYSFYLYKKKGLNKLDKLYYTGLLFNVIWSILFFLLKLRFISILWILILDILVFSLVIKYFKIDKKLGLLNLPYLIWLIIATILNISIFILN